MQHLSAQTRRGRSTLCPRLLVVSVLHAVRETGEAGRRECMKNRQEKYAGGDSVERLDLHTHGEVGRQRLIRGGWVTLEGSRNRRDGGCAVVHRCTNLRNLTDVKRVVMTCLAPRRLPEPQQRREL
jgi:hypothetical protein